MDKQKLASSSQEELKNEIKENKIESNFNQPPKRKSPLGSKEYLYEIIKEMNGFSEKEMQHPNVITQIELVLEELTSINGISLFRNLKSLTLINVGLKKIEDMSKLESLTELWLNENAITRIEGLEKCGNLKSLYICYNEITKIEGLDELKNLENLWLCNNQIEKIENLDKCHNLKQLWLGANNIEYIKNSLDNLKSLNDLNLSGNIICSFKEILNLTKLGTLQTLAFSDPHFGDNPICNLCNYQTFVLYHLNLNKLDTLILSEEAKSFAEATFMKKKMYYNMRIKTMQRTFSSLTKVLKMAKLLKIMGIEEDISFLERDMYVHSEEGKEKRERIIDKIKQKTSEIDFHQKLFTSFKTVLLSSSNLSIQRLLLELETGGNIRLEDGKGSEKWYLSCIDLLKSRFHPEETDLLLPSSSSPSSLLPPPSSSSSSPLLHPLSSSSFVDLDILRVTRIHNRFLRTKFEEKMENLVDLSNPLYKKNLEYLFFGVDPSFPNEIFHVLEEGFRPSSEAEGMGMCPYPTLVNSILAADLPRLKGGRKEEGMEEMKWRGHLLICKVLILKSALDSNNPSFKLDRPRNAIYFEKPFKLSRDEANIRPSSSSSSLPSSLPSSALPSSSSSSSLPSCLYRTFGSDEKHKLWFIEDRGLVLPEYLVEFGYVRREEVEGKETVFGGARSRLGKDVFVNGWNFEKLKGGFNDEFESLCRSVSEKSKDAKLMESKISEGILTVGELERCELDHLKIPSFNYLRYCLEKEDKNNILQASDLSKLNKATAKIINLRGLSLDHIDVGLKNWGAVVFLDLSDNKIKIIENLGAMGRLRGLNLSNNMIEKVGGLNGLQELENLNLSRNRILDFNEFQTLFENKALMHLNVQSNPCFLQIKENKVFSMILKVLPNMEVINNKEVSKLDLKTLDFEKSTLINDDLIHDHSKFVQDIIIDKINFDWKNKVGSLKLRHLKIERISSLQGLQNLRILDLGDNLINTIEGLDSLHALEELNLEKNLISNIEGLNKLEHLKILEIGQNKITSLEGLATLDNLIQLSLEDNKIPSLSSFPYLKNLMELYLSNNQLQTYKETVFLKNLPKLIILDLSLNPLALDPNYRIYTLFTLKKLKVLDGVGVEICEHQAAKDLFTGRLTEEILGERLNGSSPGEVLELDLSSCKLKDFEDVFNSQYFPNLVELNLSSNLFASVKMIGILPKLKVLILNGNKIENLFVGNEKLGLNCCFDLEIVDLSYNQLKDLNGLQYAPLKCLKILKLDHNEISKVDCLENLDQIKEIDLNNNRIRQFDINSFPPNFALKCLKIEENSLKNFSNIQKLTRMQHLFASNNRINDLPDIERLIELPNLKELELNGNAISKKPGYRQAMIKKMPFLIYLDGKEITPEEREKIEMTVAGIIPGDKPVVQNYYPGNAKVPVKISSINFDGVFGNVRFPSDINQNQKK